MYGFNRGARCIHIGFAENQSGWKFYVPSTRQIIRSLDVYLDETFSKAVALNSRLYHNTFSLRPNESIDFDMIRELETTGDVFDNNIGDRAEWQVEEGNEIKNEGNINQNEEEVEMMEIPTPTAALPTKTPNYEAETPLVCDVRVWKKANKNYQQF